MHPGAILDGFGWSVEHDYLALVPSLVRLVHVAEIERGRLPGERHPALVAFAHVRRIAIVPDVDGNLHSLLLPLYHVGHTKAVGKVEHTAQHGVLASVGRCPIRLG